MFTDLFDKVISRIIVLNIYNICVKLHLVTILKIIVNICEQHQYWNHRQYVYLKALTAIEKRHFILRK